MLSLILAAAITSSSPSRSPADYAILSGAVRAIRKSDRAVLIGVDENRDGLADHLFWFFASPAPAVDFSSSSALVEFRGDELVIVGGKENRQLVFSVGPRRHRAQTQWSGPHASFSGVGLTHQMGLANMSMAAAPHDGRISSSTYHGDCQNLDCLLDDYPTWDPFGAGGTATGCDNGGLGAWSCSITNPNGGASCSASCGSGYYACCNRNDGSAWCCTPKCFCQKY
jgi:hypothetical protein